MSNCSFPKNTSNILELDNTWSQTLPSGEVVTSKGAGTGGWSIDPNVQNQCLNGGYCPYACETGYIETQYDNSATFPYIWEVKDQNNNVKYVGGGNQYMNIEGKLIRAGGKQGLYCNNGKLIYNNQVNEYKDIACIETPRVLNIKNNSNNTITFCRTTNTFGIPQIPSVISPGESIFLTSIPNCKDGKWSNRNTPNTCKNVNHLKCGANPIWWNGDVDKKKPVNLTYFLSRADETNLTPICQANPIRASTGKESMRGIDYFPYIITIDSNYKVKVNSNNDALVGSCAGYDTYLGNPKYGLRLYNKDQVMIGQVEYSGNSNNCYSYIINRGQVHYDCKAFRKGLKTKTHTSFSPIIIEIYDVPDTPTVTLPNGYCKMAICDTTILRKAKFVKNRAIATRQETTTTTSTTSSTSTSTKIVITILVIIIIIVIIVLIVLLIRYWLRVRKANKELREAYQTQQVRDIGITPVTSTYGVVLDPADVPDVIDLSTFGQRPTRITL
jgi:hypothetical protein